MPETADPNGAHPGARVIAIDGPAACGKSTVVRLLAARLGALSFSSGLVYRAVTWLVLERGDDPADPEAVRRDLAAAPVEIVEREGALRVVVAGVDPGDALHGTRVTEAIHWIADDAAVRAALLPLQRRLPPRNVIAEGRDLGTVVFPDAALKVFLTASLEERARRRHAELRGRLGERISLEEVAEQLRRRDEKDASRAVAPLRPAPDARVVDTTDRTPEEVVEEIVGWVPPSWLPPDRDPPGRRPRGGR